MDYRWCMYRAVVMFPKAAPSDEADALIQGIADSFRASAGFHAATRSLGALMGPGARAGDVGAILEADFASLGDVMAALQDDGFHDVKARSTRREPPSEAIRPEPAGPTGSNRNDRVLGTCPHPDWWRR